MATAEFSKFVGILNAALSQQHLLGFEGKLAFSCPVATAEVPKFAGILSAPLSQNHLLGFEIAQLEFHHLH